MFTLLFITGKNQKFSSVVGVKVPIKNVNKPRRNIQTSMSEAKMLAFIEEALC